MELPIHNISYSLLNGPGRRMVIWVQGCKLNCPGCFNQESHSYSKKSVIIIEELAEIINNDLSLDGLTISGGEPLDFSNELIHLFKLVNNSLSKIIFTGYTIKEIVKDSLKLKLIKNVDLVLSGRYNNKLSHPYFGKKIINITNKIDLTYFSPSMKIEYILNNSKITKTGIFKIKQDGLQKKYY